MYSRCSSSFRRRAWPVNSICFRAAPDWSSRERARITVVPRVCGFFVKWIDNSSGLVWSGIGTVILSLWLGFRATTFTPHSGQCRTSRTKTVSCESSESNFTAISCGTLRRIWLLRWESVRYIPAALRSPSSMGVPRFLLLQKFRTSLRHSVV